jgi:hypothetical protein
MTIKNGEHAHKIDRYAHNIRVTQLKPNPNTYTQSFRMALGHI